MRKLTLLLPTALTFACVAPSLRVPAGELSPTAVSFAPGYEASFSKAYGAQEVPALRSQIVRSVSQSLNSAGSACGLALDVTIERAAPTHPTMQQQMANPSLDPAHTVYRDSGASLVGHVLDSSGHVLATVTYDSFNGYLPLVVPTRDPWSQARVAIDTFAHRLVKACTKQSAQARS